MHIHILYIYFSLFISDLFCLQLRGSFTIVPLIQWTFANVTYVGIWVEAELGFLKFIWCNLDNKRWICGKMLPFALSKDGFLYKSMGEKKRRRGRVCTSTCPIKKLKKRGLIACHIYFSTSKDLVYLHWLVQIPCIFNILYTLFLCQWPLLCKWLTSLRNKLYLL